MKTFSFKGFLHLWDSQSAFVNQHTHHLEGKADWIISKLAEYDGKEVEIEISIKEKCDGQ